jgi:trans-aconitate 2-methyltransferase
MTAARDTWDPQAYGRFAAERAAPALDLLDMLAPVPGGAAADLGCGPGTLTRELHRRSGAARTVGVDSSARMLERAAAAAREEPGLAFVNERVEDWEPDGPLDVVFSNAALHWVPDHVQLFSRMRGWLAPGGQLAIQIPDNLDAVTHRTAVDVASEAPFAQQLGPEPPRVPLLSAEQYAVLLHDLGFTSQRVELRVYLHLLDNGPEGLIDWFRGSLLSEYERRLDPDAFTAYLARYRELLLQRVESRRPYPLTFPRILMWGRLPA